MLHEAAIVAETARGLSTGKVHRLHVAVPTTTLTDVLAPFIATLGPDDPVPLLRSLDQRGAAAAITSGADLAIVHRPPPRELARRPLAVLPLLAYVRRDDPWGPRQHVHLDELSERTLVLMTGEFRPRTLLDSAMDAAEIAYGDILECSNAHVAQALAAAGHGVAVVSDDPRFDLVPLTILDQHGIPLQIRLYAAWDPRHHAASVLESMSERLAAFCVERYGSKIAPAPITINGGDRARPRS